jgi:hypothetical protein
VNELLLAYAAWLEKTRPTADGKPSRSGTSPRFAFRTLRETFGTLPVAEFGPKSLKTLREAWVAAGLSRKVINGRVGAVKRLFRWAVGEELAGPELYQRLQAVEGLRAGQTEAHDWAPVKPAVMDDIDKVLPFMPPVIRALTLVQLHSAARAGELVIVLNPHADYEPRQPGLDFEFRKAARARARNRSQPKRVVCDKSNRSVSLDGRVLACGLEADVFAYIEAVVNAYPRAIAFHELAGTSTDLDGVNQSRLMSKLPPKLKRFSTSNRGRDTA